MALVETVALIVTPIVIAGITQLVKTVPVIADAGLRVTIIRALVAIMSLLTSIGLLAIGDISNEQFDPTLIDAAVLATFNALAATGVWFFTKKMR